MSSLLHTTPKQNDTSSPRFNASWHTIRHFLETMRRHDPALIDHGQRTAIYSLLMGKTMDLDDHALGNLSYAALLHDIGKLTLPNEVIFHNGCSIIGEYVMAECNPQAAAEILRPWPSLQDIAKLIVLHHEHWDGSGNPFGMRGTLIPLGARILSLADTVDQLLNQRKVPRTEQIDIVIRIFRTLSGSRFDPEIVEVFAETFSTSNQPIITLLLSNEDWAIANELNSVKHHHLFQEDSIYPHVKNILELTRPLYYDPISA